MAERQQLKSVLSRPPTDLASSEVARTGKSYGFDEETIKALEATPPARARTNILSDLPAENDTLGFTPLVRTLCNVVLSRSTETPITIAVDGQWGSGKSSILKMVETQARMIGFSCIWLNAWSLESAENLIAAVAREIQGELERRHIASETSSNKILNFITGALGGLVDIATGNTSGALIKALNLKTSTGTIEGRIQEVASIVSSQQAFRDLVKLLIESDSLGGRRLLVFIDDVDRALPDQIATILKNLKLILESEGCIFLLAMDMAVVAAAIEEHYQRNSSASGSVVVNVDRVDNANITATSAPPGRSDGFGYRYLEKLVQLRVAVPRLSRTNLLPFLEALCIAPEIVKIVLWAPPDEVLNPRRLKRFINWLSLTLQLLTAIRVPAKFQSLTVLQLLMLRRYYPTFYAELSKADLKYEHLQTIWVQHARAFINERTGEEFWAFMAPLADTDLPSALRFIEDSSVLEMDPAVTH